MIEIQNLETANFKGFVFLKNQKVFGTRNTKTNEYHVVTNLGELKPLKMIKCNGVKK